MMQDFLDLTWNNPIFMIVAIGVIWFIPGIVLRRVLDKRYRASLAESQAKKIARLYPDKPNE